MVNATALKPAPLSSLTSGECGISPWEWQSGHPSLNVNQSSRWCSPLAMVMGALYGPNEDHADHACVTPKPVV